MNKLTFFVFSLLIFNKTYAQSDQQQIENTISTFFDGIYKRDTVLISSVLHKNCSLNSVNILAGKPAQHKSETMSGFFKSIASIPSNVILEERLLVHKIQVDEALAIDWTPYEFYVNQKLSHKGTNVFTLVKTGDSWKIFSIIDTRKK
ncbi:nuclear transport factor 2 family protein [Lacihabitans soyangensis]|uniref:Nuclear transport factor 2 family protein n=1 Tax=Lacihabitans soyangensis TaxID=869394 RepID=A0AAE3KXD1_9BACT|nr:nuclear transport factor 2 family protein [Lacihabitans soyangensis]MCP9764695.1 nuclear transport factor 2 family protein [Lacihabitans soyangensis]